MASVAKLTEISETRINGNIGDFKKEVKKLRKADIVLLINVMKTTGFTYEEAITKVYAALA